MILKPKRELRTSQFTIAITPSIADALRKIVYMRKTTFNDLANVIMAEYVTAHSDEIKQYDKTIGGVT